MINGQVKSTEDESPSEPPPPPMVPIEEPKPQSSAAPVVTSFPNFANYTKRFVDCLARNLHNQKDRSIFSICYKFDAIILQSDQLYTQLYYVPDGDHSSGQNEVIDDGIDMAVYTWR